MPIYDYECEHGHLIESRQGYDDISIECPLCGAPANRLFTPYGQSLVTETGSLNGRKAGIPRDEKRYDVSLFQEACAEREFEHKKAENIVGRPLASENLWGKAKKKADRIIAGKEPPVTAQTRFKN